ncbi:MFS transporter [Weissella sagaensis]|uniref:MFS transporter n=1 Tax=Weissella sagaensis TaxID=2559928 RepID=A0ABW1RSJ8_9LACO|nr:MFS transporter [Weissella sagaensis]MBU7568050.1 MFS transporter [Weissella hellenica]QDJ58271.1 MFS transporter [Weissella hellenica]QEA57264.1 MFS transporter [Weissella hellenica]UEG66378.1 MFS transporter [Weissella hellenica]
MVNKEKLFNKGFISVTLINFLVYFVYYLLMVIIAVVAQDKLGATLSQAGLASGIYVIGTLIARLYIGKKLEVMGRKQVLRIGIVLYLVTTIMYLYMPSLIVLYGVRLLNGFFYGMVSTATNAIVTAYIPLARRGEGINYYGLSTSLAAAIGPFLGMLLLQTTSINFIVIMASVMLIVTTMGCFTIKVNNMQLTTKQRAIADSWQINTFIDTKVVFIAGIAFLMGLAYSSVLSFLASYVVTINLVSISSLFFVVYALVITVTRPIAGRIFDQYGENSVMYPSYIFLAIGLLVLSMTTSSWSLLLSGALIGLGYGTFMSNGQAVALHLEKDVSRIGVALSTYFVGLDLGIGVGPYLLGALRRFVDFKQMYIIVAVLPIICAILYRLFYKGLPQKQHI